MDLSGHIFDEIMIERDDFAFNLEVAYERLSEFCSLCKTIGHHVQSCKWLHPLTFVTTEDCGKHALQREMGAQGY
jgi:hypothetical protein